jgi:endoglucanase
MNVLPRWRGFNLVDMVEEGSRERSFCEDDFRWISDWGFDFVRLPLCYTVWTDHTDLFTARQEVLEKIDRAVRLGQRYGLHVCLNLHRAPGYCVGGGPEPLNLWKDPLAEKAFCFQWDLFAKRYKGIAAKDLSFNLVNEPQGPSAEMSLEDHERVVRAAVTAIRRIDPDRLIIADGIGWGNVPSLEFADLRIAQSCRGYKPAAVTHYKAHWGGWAEVAWKDAPTWPAHDHRDGSTWDRPRLVEHYQPWADLINSGIGVHSGEVGCMPTTPHAVCLAWFEDVLGILTSMSVGYALWNFRGAFGILDSQRTDVAYEDWHGHKLDKKLLTLLQKY